MPPAPSTPLNTAPVKPVRISGPTYYTYKPDPVRPVSFSGITPQPRNVAFEPGLGSLIKRGLNWNGTVIGAGLIDQLNLAAETVWARCRAGR